MREIQRIGVWQTAFLGDAVLTLPLLQALHEAFPEAELHFVVRAGVQELFTAQPGITSVTGFDKRGTQRGLGAAWAFGRTMAARELDLWVSAHASLRSAVTAFATGAPMRVGYAAPLYNRMAYTHTVQRAFDQFDEIERLLRLLRPLDLEPASGDFPWPDMVLPPSAEIEAEELLGSLPGPLLGVHPGSTWPTKQWPVEYFAQVAATAVEAGATVVVFGGPGEEADAETVVRGAVQGAGRVINLAGAVSLPVLAACIRRLDAYLTNDSGPMHLAWMQRVPTLALFGPTVRELGFFPRGRTAHVLEVAELSCRPCGLHGPKRCPQGHHRCMRDMQPAFVWEHLAPMLGA
ncbi:heptosyltransferase-2 [Paucidesulfovibrio gracilis DSM 16080]|uniref:Heptosyltransferase-2 n=1 Tax=Paucidesulfovibrio gracilis DSM 16080 TaxID=1121449 RepID=A0A1T4Y4H7_9BACT|nr:glycosyltransferase family 9 protein [Paucidesulfovibrio gracilis]SKA96221.1 heptosyltransferase-2 [Paucidesulfovibrio gracilis DSM 16080]